jgi:hypothetical protein
VDELELSPFAIAISKIVGSWLRRLSMDEQVAI